MSNPMITLTGVDALSLDTADEAFDQKALLLSSAQQLALAPITSNDAAQAVAVVIRDMKAFTRLIEDSRVAVKAPLLDRCRKIDELAKSLTQDLEQELKRLGSAVSYYQAEQIRAAEEARRLAWQKEQQIKREAEEKERAERALLDAERQRILEEGMAAVRAAAANALKAKTDDQIIQAEQERIKALAEAAAKSEKNFQDSEAAATARQEKLAQDIAATRTAAVTIAPPKLAGIGGRKTAEFEVTDIVALYEAAPYLVTLTPNKPAIKNALKNMQEGQSLPGVKWWWSFGVSVRE